MTTGNILVLDVGGSFLKYGVADEKGALLPGSVGEAPARADESPEKVYEAFEEVIRRARETAPLAGACACFPGPFDYTHGVFRMKHKFQALFGCSILPPFERAGLPVRFLHDSTAYILGEVSDGTLRDAKNPCCVMLGTGLGYTMMKDGKVLIDESQTPALSLWCAPFREGIAEDYVSTRAIQTAYGQPLSVKDIAGLARQGDEKALQAFRKTGEALSELMGIIDRRFHPDKLALGGQIARSADLLHLNLPFPWEVSHHLDDAALRGAAYYALHSREECTAVLPKIQL